MSGVTLRSVKGSALTHTELDNNWGYLLPNVSSKSANYTVVGSNEGDIIDVDATSGDITISLTAAATLGDGFAIYVRKNDSSSNSVIIDPDGSETINGFATKSLTTQYQSLKIICDGSNWITTEDLSSGFATLASPALTGTPTAPTAALGTNSTQIATTEFLNNNVQVDGTTTSSSTSTPTSWTDYLTDTVTVSTNTTLMITATVTINLYISRSCEIRIQVDGVTYGIAAEASTGNDDGQTHVLTTTAIVSGLTAGSRTIAVQHYANGGGCNTLSGTVSFIAVG